MNTLRNKLICTYALIALFIVITVSILFNVFMQRLFMEYAQNKQEKQLEQIVQQVNQSFRRNGQAYSQELFEVIGSAALQNGMILHINSNEQEIDWDIRQHRLEQCKLVLEHAEYNMHSVAPHLSGGYQEQSFLLGDGNGTITVGFYGPYNFNDDEVFLITTINRILVGITISSLLLAVLIGVYMAQKLMVPISDVINTTRRISMGELGIQASTNSKTKEISELVTSVNEMSSRLNQIERIKRRLTSDVAHELRTPISNIRSQTEAMIDGVLLPDKARLMGISNEIDRITAIVNDLRKLDDIEDNTSALNKERIEVESFLSEIIQVFQVELEKKRLSVSVQCAPVLAYADRIRLAQIVTNILSNAIKYTPENGSIWVKAYHENDFAVFSIADNGCGISKEDLPYIFERFYRADKSRTRSTGGSGIGLAITKALVEAHGGRIWADSELRKGTAIQFTIPAGDIF